MPRPKDPRCVPRGPEGQGRPCSPGQRIARKSDTGLGKPGPSPGDEFVTTDSPLRLPKTNARVGRLDIIEVAMGATRSSLTVSARLPGGRVQVQGVFNPNNRQFTLPVVGGTGAYLGAHGEATLSSSGSVPTLTFDLLA